MESRSSLLFLLPVLVGLSLTPCLAQTQKPDVAASFRCPVTVPNSNEPPNSEPPSEFPAWVAERNREGDTLVMAGTGPMLTSFWDVERNPEGDALLMAETRPMRTSFHGNGKLWTILPPRVGASVERVSLEKYGEQATAVQIDWWEMGRGLLVIKGTRLDGPAGPLRVEEWWRGPIPRGSLASVPNKPATPPGFVRAADGISQVMATVIFPTQGCWEITGKIYDIDDSALTFVVEVRVPR
jgi:hypothetical protein